MSQMPGNSPEPGGGEYGAATPLGPFDSLVLCTLDALHARPCLSPGMPQTAWHRASAMYTRVHYCPRSWLSQGPGRSRAEPGCVTPAPSGPSPQRKRARSQGHQGVAAQAGLSQRVSRESRRLISLQGWRRPGLGGRGLLVTRHPLP